MRRIISRYGKNGIERWPQNDLFVAFPDTEMRCASWFRRVAVGRGIRDAAKRPTDPWQRTSGCFYGHPRYSICWPAGATTHGEERGEPCHG